MLYNTGDIIGCKCHLGVEFIQHGVIQILCGAASCWRLGSLGEDCTAPKLEMQEKYSVECLNG